MLRQEIADISLSMHGQQLHGVKASFGVAGYPDHADDWQTVLHLADAALYQAKREGRNRVIVYELGQEKSTSQSV